MLLSFFSASSFAASKSFSSVMQRRGFRIGNFNWPSLLDDRTFVSYPYAFATAQYWVDVPVHQSLHQTQLDEIIASFNNIS